MPETIYVATEAHIVPLRHGGTMNIPVGYWVAQGHELMQSHPEKWRVGARSTSSTPVAPGRSSTERATASSGAVPELTWRDRPEEVVILQGAARARIEAEALESRDGRETGGWLLLDVRGRDDTEFSAATGPGERAKFEPNRVGLDIEYRVAVEETAQRMDSGLMVSGDFHTHMGRSARPSEGDRTAWCRNFEFLENELGARAAWTGILLTSDYDDDWRYPELHAFVVRRDPITRRLTCENAIVKEVN